MIKKRPSAERGHAQIDWLESFHTFSFAEYHDPRHMGFRTLRVINEDFVAPGQGFAPHPHKDMEIVTYILDGALKHRDSMGNGSTIRPGDVQRMSAGTGVVHSEMNASDKEKVHLLQIWIFPEKKGLEPGYEQKFVDAADKKDRLKLVASNDGKGVVRIHQDARIYASHLSKGKSVELPIGKDRHAWVQVARGAARLNGTALAQGDGAAASGEENLALTADEDSEILLFDLA